jgi:hypothetical protein
MAMCADMGVGLVPYSPKLRARDNHKLRPTLAGHLGARRCRPRQRGVRRRAAAAVRLDRRLPLAIRSWTAHTWPAPPGSTRQAATATTPSTRRWPGPSLAEGAFGAVGLVAGAFDGRSVAGPRRAQPSTRPSGRSGRPRSATRSPTPTRALAATPTLRPSPAAWAPWRTGWRRRTAPTPGATTCAGCGSRSRRRW